jgi:hypothetical protein
MNINTNEAIIPIERDGKPVGELKFNPGNVGFVDRFYNLIGEFEVKEKEFQKRSRELDQNNEPGAYGIPKNTGEGLKLLNEICIYMREKIDYVFGEGTSQMVFGDYNNPNMFAQFFDGITPYIQKARNDKLAKYKPSGKNVI